LEESELYVTLRKIIAYNRKYQNNIFLSVKLLISPSIAWSNHDDISLIFQVASFTGEKRAINIYNQLLVIAYRSGVQEGIFSGFGVGVVMLIVFCSYAVAVWFGAKMVLEKGYTGGEVISVIVAVLTGSM
jgi:hypothetical protein